MAYQPRQISPSDLQPDVVNGVNIPFSAPGVFEPNYTSADALKAAIINYFLTNPGERPGNPQFGGGLRAFVFTQIQDENLDFLKEDIQGKFDEQFPQVNVIGLEVFRDRENLNELTVSIKYAVSNTTIADSLTLNFE